MQVFVQYETQQNAAKDVAAPFACKAWAAAVYRDVVCAVGIAVRCMHRPGQSVLRTLHSGSGWSVAAMSVDVPASTSSLTVGMRTLQQQRYFQWTACEALYCGGFRGKHEPLLL
jgi:hypothetical protein